MKHNNENGEIDTGLLDTRSENVSEEMIINCLAKIIATMYLKEVGVICTEDGSLGWMRTGI